MEMVQLKQNIPHLKNSMDEYNLQRFLDAQKNDYAAALAEIKNGRKRSHWMWYIFPQLQGPGVSETSKYYAIKDLGEASAYLMHPVLGTRLAQISSELINLTNNNATQIFGSPDDTKLKSSMTLFAATKNTNQLFDQVLQKFFNGTKDPATLKIISRGQ
jgi:uncharacterized protein (DUF1810 family)